MSFTETTHTSWFTRLKNGVVGILVGLILVVGMIVLLAWNEGRAVQTYRSLVEGAGLVVSVSADRIDPAMEGKLIHISGKVTPDGTPEDPTFSVSAQGAAALRRDVEMYQWVEESRSETKKTLGGGEETVTTYSYKKDWQSRPIDSGNFREGDGHANPPMPFESERFAVETAHIGAFVVDGETIANLATTKPLTISPIWCGRSAIRSPPACPSPAMARRCLSPTTAMRRPSGTCASASIGWTRARRASWLRNPATV